MPSHLTILLLTIVLLAVIIPSTSGGSVYAFGAGNIPGFAFLEGKAFRHGDIEDVLSDLLKRSAGAGLLGLGGGSKFGNLDIKRVYFGNWLRDYSQAIDVAALKQLPQSTIMNLITVLGFLAHGYATGSFEVTEERLGVYLPVEHIDNPKGYADGEDARAYHPKLRGPVDPIEYAVDPRTGMKNYIANETGHWDTSKAHVRRTLDACIRYGREYRKSKKQEDKWEAYRLLGSALHTLEDFPAHSNFCELALISQGYTAVFPHVGSNTCNIYAPNGKYVFPLVTGTFGGSDFVHSLLGEATDHISSSSVSDLSKEVANANGKKNDPSKNGVGSVSNIKDLVNNVPGLSTAGNAKGEINKELDGMDRMKGGPKKNPNEMTDNELRNAIWPILLFRDNLVMNISQVIERIPGLSEAIDTIMESVQVWVFTTLEPYLKPILQSATASLQESSAAVINNHDQYEVFHNPNSSDPTHSFLSKDHFGKILNEPAGNLAKIIVTHAVPLVTSAWDDPSIDPRTVTEDILQCLFHPDFHDPNSKIQREMLSYMQKWMSSQGSAQGELVSRLSRDCVQRHEDVRFEGQVSGQGHDHGLDTPAGFPGGPSGSGSAGLGGLVGKVPGMGEATSLLGKFGINAPGLGEPKRNNSGNYYTSPSGPPPYGGGGAYTTSPPAHQSSFGGYGGVPGGGYNMPSGSGGDGKDKKKKDKKDKKDKKKDKKDKKRGLDGDWEEDSEDSERERGGYSYGGAPSGGYGGGANVPSGGFSMHGGGGSVGGGYGPPSGPPPGQQQHQYAPPSGPPPPTRSTFTMPSAPGAAPPSFPPTSSFGGPPAFGNTPGFPSAMPSTFPGGSGFMSQPGGGMGFPEPSGFGGFSGSSGSHFRGGSGSGGGPSFPNPSGYPGAGFHPPHQGGGSGW